MVKSGIVWTGMDMKVEKLDSTELSFFNQLHTFDVNQQWNDNQMKVEDNISYQPVANASDNVVQIESHSSLETTAVAEIIAKIEYQDNYPLVNYQINYQINYPLWGLFRCSH